MSCACFVLGILYDFEKKVLGVWMNKSVRQYIGLFSAILSYYVIHEGAHLIYAMVLGVFKEIKFMGLGMQIDVYVERMTGTQLGVFCLLGSLATAVVAYVLIGVVDIVAKKLSKGFLTCFYYITIALLLLDPLYLSVLYKFFGGGDMNGIKLLIPQSIAQTMYGILLLINGLIFWKVVLPKYKKFFPNEKN